MQPNAKARLPATVFTYSFGIVSTLVFGAGMCLAMGQIGSGITGSLVLGIIHEWLREDCKDSVEHIISLMQLCIANHER